MLNIHLRMLYQVIDIEISRCLVGDVFRHTARLTWSVTLDRFVRISRSGDISQSIHMRSHRLDIMHLGRIAVYF